jgi:hypothetical protein
MGIYTCPMVKGSEQGARNLSKGDGRGGSTLRGNVGGGDTLRLCAATHHLTIGYGEGREGGLHGGGRGAGVVDTC